MCGYHLSQITKWELHEELKLLQHILSFATWVIIYNLSLATSQGLVIWQVVIYNLGLATSQT
jgi:hypothetical protein